MRSRDRASAIRRSLVLRPSVLNQWPATAACHRRHRRMPSVSNQCPVTAACHRQRRSMSTRPPVSNQWPVVTPCHRQRRSMSPRPSLLNPWQVTAACHRQRHSMPSVSNQCPVTAACHRQCHGMSPRQWWIVFQSRPWSTLDRHRHHPYWTTQCPYVQGGDHQDAGAMRQSRTFTHVTEDVLLATASDAKCFVYKCKPLDKHWLASGHLHSIGQ